MYEIKTSNYITSKRILIDGNEWTVTDLGAGDELVLSQSQRRATYIQKKINDGTAVDADYDLADKLDLTLYTLLEKMFKDNTQDNSQVKKWLNDNPMTVIMEISKDIKKQAAEKNAKETIS